MAQTPERRAPIIVFEGIDGVGKSVQTRMLLEHFERQGVPAMQTGPYIATDICRAIKPLVIGDGNVSPLTQAALLIAGQMECGEAIRTSQAADGTIAVMDRGWLSTLVYQGLAHQNPAVVQLLLPNILKYAEFFRPPDLVVWLVMSPAAAHARLEEARRGERFKSRGVEWAQQLSHGYNAVYRANYWSEDNAQSGNDLWDAALRTFSWDDRDSLSVTLLGEKQAILDANQSPETVHKEVVALVKRLVRHATA